MTPVRRCLVAACGLAALASIVGAAGCEAAGGASPAQPPYSASIVRFTGTVVWVDLETGFYGLVSDDGRKYEPLGLPETFKRHGLRVQVTGTEEPGMVSVNMWGTMLRVVEIAAVSLADQFPGKVGG